MSRKFNISEEDFDIKKPLNKSTHNAQEVQEAQDTHHVQEVQDVFKTKEIESISRQIGTTQGKKGQKLKRINMAFSDLNHDYITHESRRRGISATAFVNLIIDEYINKN